MALLLASNSGVAQGPSAAIVGRVFDPNGKAVIGTGASIHLKNRDTSVEYTSPIRDDGEYKVVDVPAGSYNLTLPFVCCLFTTYAQENIVLQPGEARRLDLHLRWGQNLGTIGDDPTTLNSDLRVKAGTITGPIPRMPDGRPDLSGYWVPAYGPGDGPPRPVSLKPWAMDIQRRLRELKVDPSAQNYCLPQHATPTLLPFQQKLVQSSRVIIHMTEYFTPGFRQIFLDGRAHPTDWNPSWLGHSVGRWEGDRLVVETVGFNEITPGYGVHTEQLRVVERFQRLDLGHLEVEISAEDPDAFEEPWKANVRWALAPDEEYLEWVCSENNRDSQHYHDLLPWRGRP